MANVSSIHLRRTDENSADIDTAASRYGHRVGIAGVLDHLNRRAVRTRAPKRMVTVGSGASGLATGSFIINSVSPIK